MKENRNMKEKFKRDRKSNQKGFTMVELLLSILLLTIVSASLFSFMIMSGSMFQKANAEVDLQSEAQRLKNYMNDLVTDTVKGLTYVKKEEEPENTYGADWCLVIYGEDVISLLAWEKESGQVYLLEKKNYSVNADGSYSVNLTENEKNVSGWPLLSEGVSEFECGLDEVTEEHRIFSAEIKLSSKDATYHTTHTIALRNDIFYNGIGKDYEMGTSGSHSYVKGLTLVPGFADRSRGSIVEFTHTVSAVGNPDTTVIYAVEGNLSEKTKITETAQGAKLFIGEEERAAMLTVTCRLKSDETIASTAIVNITSVSSISIFPSQQPTYNGVAYYPASVIDFTAQVEGNFISENGGGVDWELQENQSGAMLQSFDSHSCKVKLGPEKDKTVILKAISKVDSNVTKEYVIQTADVEIGDLYIEAQGGEYKIDRGDSLQLWLLVEGQRAEGNVNVKWEIEDNPLKESLTIDENGVLKASTSIDFEKSYRIKVKALVTKRETGAETKEVTTQINIKPVNISFEPEYAVLVLAKDAANNPSRIKIVVEGLRMEEEDVIIRQTPYVRGLKQRVVKDGKNAILSLNMTSSKPAKEYAALTASLKSNENVKSGLQVYFLQYNMIYEGKYVYVPVPGDSLNLLIDEDKDGIPDVTKEVRDKNGVLYGYTSVRVNDVVCHYYVNKENVAGIPAWFVRIQNQLKTYTYNEKNQKYEEVSLNM